MSDQNPLMAFMLESNSFTGPAEDIENQVLPIPEQMEFGPGDVGIMAMANTGLERDFTVIKGLDPAKYAETFPDWDQRPLHALCKYFSVNDSEEKVGWFSRLKLMKISTYRYRETRRWRTEGYPEVFPDWVEDCYTKFADALAQAAPELVPRAVSCPKCHKRKVQLCVDRRLQFVTKA